MDEKQFSELAACLKFISLGIMTLAFVSLMRWIFEKDNKDDKE